MSDSLVTIVTVLFFLTVLAAEVPVAFALLTSGALGLYLLGGWAPTDGVLGALPFTTTSTYELVLIPMFILMGVLVSETGIAEEIYGTANRLVGRLPGGLAMAALVACALFGGISGSSAADVATIGRITLREMRRHGYSVAFAAAVVAAGGTVAILIPPSIVMVIYGILTQESIGKLLLAGLVPGILSSAAMMLTAYLLVRRGLAGAHADDLAVPTPSLSDLPGGPSEGGQSVPLEPGAVLSGGHGIGAPALARPRISLIRMANRAVTNVMPSASAGAVRASHGGLRLRVGRVSGVLYAGVLFAVVMGGIYTGVFTATEAGAVGAFAALILGLGKWYLDRARQPRRYGFLGVVVSGLSETAVVTGMIFAILVGGAIFTQFLLTAGLPSQFTSWVVGLDAPPIVIVGLIIAILIPLGMLLDGLSILLITVPLAYPVITELGYDGIWFGVLMVMAIEVGLITPPVGINVYIMAGLEPSLTAESIFRKVMPFVATQICLMAIFIAFPPIITWLPGLAHGS